MKRLLIITVTIMLVVLSACSGGGNKTATESSNNEARGISDEVINIGLLVDLTGPYQAAGTQMKVGVKTYFDYINDNGGINGRQIKLFTEDNGANPATTATAINKLVFNDNVFALAGIQGSAAFAGAYDFIDENQVPTFSLGFSSVNHIPHRPMIFSSAVPYSLQGSRVINYIVKELDISKPQIGVLYQDDDFGIDFLNGAKEEAKALGVEILAEEAFPRGAEDISSQVANLQRKGAEQVFVAGIYTTAGQFMKEANKIGYEPVVIGPGPSRGDPFFDIAGKTGKGYLLVDYFAPLDDPALDEIKGIVAKYAPGELLNNNMMFGLANAITLVEIFKAVGDVITPKSFVTQAEKMSNIDMKGLMTNITFTPEKHYGITETRVFESNIPEKKWTQVSEPKAPEIKDINKIGK